MRFTRSFLMLVLLGMIPNAASAHAVGVEARLQGGRILIEGYFDDDTAASGATVTLTSEDGTLLGKARTDAQGRCSLPVPPPGRYRLLLDARAGHLARTTLTVPEQSTASQTAPSPGNAKESVPGRVVVSDGPTRETFTGTTRWLLAGIGLSVIGLLAFLAHLITRRGQQSPTPPTFPERQSP